ncbi:peptidyl-alpha-hydroxyglycine alpha-amidating lyase family protein [Chloroflexota bacterium]
MRYVVGNMELELVQDWARLPEGWSFKDVCGIATDEDDNVYILNRSEHPIIVLSREGQCVGSWGEGYFTRVHGARRALDGSLFCTDDFANVVAKFSLKGELLMQLGEKGKASDTGYHQAWDSWQRLATIERGGPPFNRPTGVAESSDGDIYISDGYGNARVHRFDAAGNLKQSWGQPGGGPSQFRLPHDIAVDSRDRVLVADRENSRIQLFDLDGKYLEEWNDFLLRPMSISFDKDWNVYIAELAMRVSVLSPDGKLLGRWGNRDEDKDSALFHGPHAIAVDSHGDVYVGDVAVTHCGFDRGSNTIRKFRRVG